MLRDLEGNSFATGCAVYVDTDRTESSPKIYVRVRSVNLPARVLAQLDTGAAWSILNVEIARRMGALDAQGEPLVLSTRTGKVVGKLVRAPVSLVAEWENRSTSTPLASFLRTGDMARFLATRASSNGFGLRSTHTETCSTSASTRATENAPGWEPKIEASAGPPGVKGSTSSTASIADKSAVNRIIFARSDDSRRNPESQAGSRRQDVSPAPTFSDARRVRAGGRPGFRSARTPPAPAAGAFPLRSGGRRQD